MKWPALTRRKLLAGAASGCALGLALGTKAFVSRPRPVASTPGVEEIIDAIVLGSERTMVGVAADFLRRGASSTELLAAAFLAPILNGGEAEDLHPTLVVPSIFEHIAAHGSRSERLVPTIWAVWNAQSWARKERTPPRSVTPTMADPRALAKALAEGDPDRAGGAIVSLVRTVGVDGAAARLGFEASHLRGDPHLTIYAAQASRALGWIEPRFAEPVLVSVARRIARAGTIEPRPRTAIRLDEGDPTTPEAIADQLMSVDARTSTPGSFLDGRSSASIWQALCLVAIDTRLAEGHATNLTGGRGLHQTTLLDALWFIHDRSSPAERPFVLADAAERVLESRRHGRRSSRFEEALGRVRTDGSSFVDNLRREVAGKGTAEHDFKFFGAAAAIAAKLPPPVRDRWWAAASLADPIGSTNRWSLADEAASLVADAHGADT